MCVNKIKQDLSGVCTIIRTDFPGADDIREYKFIPGHGIIAPYSRLIYRIDRIILVVVSEGNRIVHGPHLFRDFLLLRLPPLRYRSDKFFLGRGF